jgi:hypothetical protein
MTKTKENTKEETATKTVYPIGNFPKNENKK